MKPQTKTTFFWGAVIVAAMVLWFGFSQGPTDEQEKPFGELVGAIENGEVKELSVKETSSGHLFTGEFKDTGSRFSTYGKYTENVDAKIHDAVRDHQMVLEVRESDDGSFLVGLYQWVPLLIVFILFMLFMRNVQSGNGRAMSFGKSRARLVNESQNKVTFADVAGVEESKTELEEIVQFLKDPKKFTRLGGRIPKGVMLMGQPGTGKTLLARAIAGEAGVPFFSIAGSDFVEMFVGVGASRVRDLFETGKKNAPCIIFIDEIDAVGRHRGAGMGGGHDEREQTLNQLLVEMDGFESNEGVIIIAATNRPDVLDPAIMRPGRFDRRVVVPLPDVVGREKIFKVHARKVPLSTDVDIEILARGTPGMSGADIENLVNEAALVAGKTDQKKVKMKDFEAARDKVMMGSERRSMVMTEKDLERTAYHESGHTLVGELLSSEKDDVHKVTIIPRGRALGLTMHLPDDRTSYTKTYAENRIAVLMGGRIAEELIFGEYNTGASNDIDQATDLAKRMVCEWGMSPKMGPLAYGKKDGEVFLGKEFNRAAQYSQNTAEEIDREVKRIIMEQYERARELLKGAIEVLHKMSKSLLDYETLDKADIDMLMSGGEITRARPEIRIKTREQIERDRSGARSVPDVTVGGPLPEPGAA